MVILFGNHIYAQDQGLFFNGIDQSASFTAPINFPRGSVSRTIEFWVKVIPGENGTRQSIIDLGEQINAGNAFGIQTETVDGKAKLGFWGHNADRRQELGVLPDEGWHFVAVTYSEPMLICYIDGEQTFNAALAPSNGVKLNTVAGKCYIGGLASRGWMLKGAVDNVAIWNKVRTAEEIKKDMIPSPCLVGNEPGLVAFFQFNEASGNSFASKITSIPIIGTLTHSTLWTKAIEINPSPISEGIWFVIQNKSDVDTDFDIPARRMALKVNSQNQIVMTSIPLTGDYDEFLWRTIKLTDGSGRYKLVNKKLGITKALNCGIGNLTIGNLGNYSEQQWVIKNVNTKNFGTNAYSLSNEFITDQKGLIFENGNVLVAAKDTFNTKQIWLFQPMSLVMGYHIPSASSDKCPINRALDVDYGVKLYATSTVQDWSILNSHLVLKNEMNSLLTSKSGLNDKQVIIISKFDFDENLISQYPLINADNYIQPAWIGPTRGGHYGKVTIVTEEMMCRVGTYSRYSKGENDRTYREFEQVVHEFAHGIDNFCGVNRSYSSIATGWVPISEWFPWKVQAWLNSSQSNGPNVNKSTLSTQEKNFLSQYFNDLNTWLPPRKLRELELEKNHQITSGTIISPDTKALFSNTETTYLTLQTDGNLVVKNSVNNDFKWGAVNSMNVSIGAKKVKFENGFLIFYNASNIEIGKIGLNAPNSRLILNSNSNPSNSSFLKIIDPNGTVLWTSN